MLYLNPKSCSLKGSPFESSAVSLRNRSISTFCMNELVHTVSGYQAYSKTNIFQFKT